MLSESSAASPPLSQADFIHAQNKKLIEDILAGTDPARPTTPLSMLRDARGEGSTTLPSYRVAESIPIPPVREVAPDEKLSSMPHMGGETAGTHTPSLCDPGMFRLSSAAAGGGGGALPFSGGGDGWMSKSTTTTTAAAATSGGEQEQQQQPPTPPGSTRGINPLVTFNTSGTGVLKLRQDGAKPLASSSASSRTSTKQSSSSSGRCDSSSSSKQTMLSSSASSSWYEQDPQEEHGVDTFKHSENDALLRSRDVEADDAIAASMLPPSQIRIFPLEDGEEGAGGHFLPRRILPSPPKAGSEGSYTGSGGGGADHLKFLRAAVADAATTAAAVSTQRRELETEPRQPTSRPLARNQVPPSAVGAAREERQERKRFPVASGATSSQLSSYRDADDEATRHTTREKSMNDDEVVMLVTPSPAPGKRGPFGARADPRDPDFLLPKFTPPPRDRGAITKAAGVDVDARRGEPEQTAASDADAGDFGTESAILKRIRLNLGSEAAPSPARAGPQLRDQSGGSSSSTASRENLVFHKPPPAQPPVVKVPTIPMLQSPSEASESAVHRSFERSPAKSGSARPKSEAADRGRDQHSSAAPAPAASAATSTPAPAPPSASSHGWRLLDLAPVAQPSTSTRSSAAGEKTPPGGGLLLGSSSSSATSSRSATPRGGPALNASTTPRTTKDFFRAGTTSTSMVQHSPLQQEIPPDLLQLAHPKLVEKLHKSNQVTATLHKDLEQLFEKFLELEGAKKTLQKENGKLQHRWNLLDHEMEAMKRQLAFKGARAEKLAEEVQYFEALLGLMYKKSPPEILELAHAQPLLGHPKEPSQGVFASPSPHPTQAQHGPPGAASAASTRRKQEAAFMLQALHQEKCQLQWNFVTNEERKNEKVLSEELLKAKKDTERLRSTYLSALDEVSRLKDQVQELKGNIRVFCRLLPVGNGGEGAVCVFPKQEQMVLSQQKCRLSQLILRSQQDFGGREVEFSFDRVFSMHDSQSTVYEEVGPLLDGIPRGFHLAIFAYGQTGSGKTFTLDGTDREPGVLRSALQDLLLLSQKTGHRLVLSVVEIYNEQVRDLLQADMLEEENIRLSCESVDLAGILSGGRVNLVGARDNSSTSSRKNSDNLQVPHHGNCQSHAASSRQPSRSPRKPSAREVMTTYNAVSPRKHVIDAKVSPRKHASNTTPRSQSTSNSRRSSLTHAGASIDGRDGVGGSYAGRAGGSSNFNPNNLEIRGVTGNDYTGGSQDHTSASHSSNNPHARDFSSSLFGSIYVENLSTQFLTDWRQAETLLKNARQHRQTGATALNDTSSRSHCIYSIGMVKGPTHVCASEGEGPDPVCSLPGYVGALHVIDLAGSERTKISKAQGQRLQEAKQINKSLSALGDTLFALEAKQAHIPFRNSKLSYLLSDVLSQSWSKVLFFANVNPAAENLQETFSTLAFARRIANIEKGRLKTGAS